MPPERSKRPQRPSARPARKAVVNTDAAAIASLTRMRNLGLYSARLLVAAGVRTPATLRALGAAAFRRVLFQRTGRVSTTLLWALEGALRDERWDQLDAVTRARLRAEVERGDAVPGS